MRLLSITLLLLSGIYLTDIPFYKTTFIKKKETIKEENPVFQTSKTLEIDGNYQELIFETDYTCGIGVYMVPLKGDTAAGLPPRLSTMDGDGNFQLVDQLPGKEILGVAFKRLHFSVNTSIFDTDSGHPYVVITDEGIFSYSVLFVSSVWRIDSLFIPNIVSVANQITKDKSDPIILLTNNGGYDLHYYSYPSLSQQFIIPLNYTPELLEIDAESLFVVGVDSTGGYSLNQYGTSTDSLIGTYSLNQLVSNPQELIATGDSVYILSSPGDSVVSLTTIDLTTSAITQSVIYPLSGARATHNEFEDHRYFTFQPKADTSISELNRQILVFDPVNNQLDTFGLNIEFDFFKHPKPYYSCGLGLMNLSWVGAKYNAQALDSFYFENFPGVFQFPLDGRPDFVNCNFGCLVNNENIREHQKIDFSLYPNPASAHLRIKLTGLSEDKPYLYEIIDNMGRIQHSGTLRGNQRIHLPLNKLTNGVYYFRLNTGESIISQKLIVK